MLLEGRRLKKTKYSSSHSDAKQQKQTIIKIDIPQYNKQTRHFPSIQTGFGLSD